MLNWSQWKVNTIFCNWNLREEGLRQLPMDIENQCKSLFPGSSLVPTHTWKHRNRQRGSGVGRKWWVQVNKRLAVILQPQFCEPSSKVLFKDLSEAFQAGEPPPTCFSFIKWIPFQCSNLENLYSVSFILMFAYRNTYSFHPGHS